MKCKCLLIFVCLDARVYYAGCLNALENRNNIINLHALKAHFSAAGVNSYRNVLWQANKQNNVHLSIYSLVISRLRTGTIILTHCIFNFTRLEKCRLMMILVSCRRPLFHSFIHSKTSIAPLQYDLLLLIGAPDSCTVKRPVLRRRQKRNLYTRMCEAIWYQVAGTCRACMK